MEFLRRSFKLILIRWRSLQIKDAARERQPSTERIQSISLKSCDSFSLSRHLIVLEGV